MTAHERQTERLLQLNRYRHNGWNGICVVCGHDYLRQCHGECACLSCNAQRQADERELQKRNWTDENAASAIEFADFVRDERRTGN